MAATKESDEDNKFITKKFNPPDNHGIDLLPIRLHTNPWFADGDSQSTSDHFQMPIGHHKRRSVKPAQHYFNIPRNNTNRRKLIPNITKGRDTQANIDGLKEICFPSCVVQPYQWYSLHQMWKQFHKKQRKTEIDTNKLEKKKLVQRIPWRTAWHTQYGHQLELRITRERRST